MSDPLIHDYDVKLATPECHPGSVQYRVSASLREDISEALPYLNAELGGLDYHHNEKILIWSSDGKMYAFRPHEIAIASAGDIEEGRALTARIVDTINRIWERRAQMKPDFKGRKSLPDVLEIYKLLPRTNCKECGFPTCMGFAAALRQDSTKLSLCRCLSERDFARVLSSGK